MNINSTNQSLSYSNESIVKLKDFLEEKNIQFLLLSLKETGNIEIKFRNRINPKHPNISPVIGSHIEYIRGVKIKNKNKTIRILNEVLHENRGGVLKLDFTRFIEKLSKDLSNYFLLFGAMNHQDSIEIK